MSKPKCECGQYLVLHHSEWIGSNGDYCREQHYFCPDCKPELDPLNKVKQK